MTALTYTTNPDNHDIQDALIGDVAVGSIHGTHWHCRLTGRVFANWRKAESPEAARAALEQAVTDWLARAGLKQTAGFATEADAWAASGARG